MTPRDSESVLDRLDRLEREATAGPWSVEESIFAIDTADGRALVLMDDRYSEGDQHQALQTGRLIALSRNHLRALLDAARAAERAVILEHDPARTDEQNALIYERAMELNAALAPLTTPSEQGNMGGLLHQERTDHLRRAATPSEQKEET